MNPGEPASEPRPLRFETEDDAIADITRLRRGYIRRGNWTLGQICWHLDRSMQLRMKPGPHAPNTPEQEARKPILDQLLATGKLPPGLVAPDATAPPADAGDEAIDACIATFKKLKAHPEPIAPHRLFGHMPDAVARRQNLIHCAHHLSHLVPTQPK